MFCCDMCSPHVWNYTLQSPLLHGLLPPSLADTHLLASQIIGNPSRLLIPLFRLLLHSLPLHTNTHILNLMMHKRRKRGIHYICLSESRLENSAQSMFPLENLAAESVHVFLDSSSLELCVRHKTRWYFQLPSFFSLRTPHSELQMEKLEDVDSASLCVRDYVNVCTSVWVWMSLYVIVGVFVFMHMTVCMSVCECACKSESVWCMWVC